MENGVFHGWSDFYLVIGAAAGALIGLMFVVITLLAGREAKRVARGAQVYITPIVFHYSVVLVISAVAVAPGLPRGVLAVMLAAGAAFGVPYAVVTALRIRHMPGEPHWSDKYYYGVLPSLIYMALGLAALSLWIAPDAAAPLVAAATVALLLVAIRNAWDLATAITQEAGDQQR